MSQTVTQHKTGPYAGLWVAKDTVSGAILVIATTSAAAWRKVEWINATPEASKRVSE